MPSPKPSKALTTATVARQLRKHILQFKEGDYLGSEDDLLAMVPVSRPTLRQAIRVLESEQLLSARRGVHGGFYARRPNLESVVNAAALYLSGRHTAMGDFMRVAEVLNQEVCRLACRSHDETARARLQAALDAHWSHPFASDEDCHRHDSDLELILLDLAQSPALELYMRVNFRFGGLSYLHLRVFQDQPERRDIWREQRQRLCQAILAREEDITLAYAQRHYRLMKGWFHELLATDPPLDTAPEFSR